MRKILALSLALLVLSASGSMAESQSNGVAALPGWQNEQGLEHWLQAWQRSCDRKPWRGQALADPTAWENACNASKGLLRVDQAWIARHFEAEAIDAEALVTGYYEAGLAGSRVRSPNYPIPLYRMPKDSHLAGQARATIDAGGLAGKGLELLWLADPIDAFFLHIQGSGQIVFPDGSSQRVGYAGNNGQTYYPIGRDLIAGGQIDRSQISMQSIAAWLRAHPGSATAMMQRNPRYIYFRPSTSGGAVGAQGVVLTAERSIAVDPTQIPYGLPVWVDVNDPDPNQTGRLQRLTVAQDTGGAIKGAGRADFFWGAGTRAADIAGRMQARGRLYVLLPRRAAHR